jgi:hypothetical protein
MSPLTSLPSPPPCGAGMYDGTLGVVGAIEALAALKAAVGGQREGTSLSVRSYRHACQHILTTFPSVRMSTLIDLNLPRDRRFGGSEVCHWCSPLRAMQGFQPKRSLEVMMFTSEEPTRFALSCIGRCTPEGPAGWCALKARAAAWLVCTWVSVHAQGTRHRTLDHFSAPCSADISCWALPPARQALMS